MAEIFIIGPLANLGMFLANWALKKYHQRKENKEHDYESKKLFAAVDSLAIFAQGRSDMIRFLHGDMVFHSATLGTTLLGSCH
jgi:hypothetical protein